MKQRTYVTILLCLGLSSFQCSAPPPRCINGISVLTINPNKLLCTNNCDCNNQSYAGTCKEGICDSAPREECPKVGQQRLCDVGKGFQICQDNGLGTKKWGDCKKYCEGATKTNCVCKPTTEDENGQGQTNDCNGKDDDCDGTIDEGCECNPGKDTEEFCYTGDPKTQGVGSCKAGTKRCLTTGKWSPCTGEVTPQTKETCNSKDDNCNGTIDEGCDCTPPGRVQLCYRGDAKTKGVGICRQGYQICGDDYQWKPCEGEVKPQQEECNLKDDDCDGLIDRSSDGKSILTRKCYDNKQGCKLQIGGSYSCTTPCQTGTQECVNGNWLPCQKAVYPRAEECNNKDDDCDGQIDNVLASNTPLCHNQLGSCESARLPPAACQNGTWRSCNVIDYQRHSEANKLGFSVNESCDNKDNNCDGRIDEDSKCLFTVVAGRISSSGLRDGVGIAALFNTPHGMTWDFAGNLYVTDTLNHSIRKVEPCGKVTTFAGNGNGGQRNGLGQVAQFLYPVRPATDNEGNMYIADTANHQIRKIDIKGNVTTFAGSGTQGSRDGLASLAQFNFPTGLTLDTKGNLYVADRGSHKIRKIDLKGNVITFAGSGTEGFQDGPANTAQFAFPDRLAFDTKGNLFVSDSSNHRIRKIDTKGNVSTYAGSGIQGFQNGSANTAQFDFPRALAFDGNGSLYVADVGNNRIRKIDSQTQQVGTTFSGNFSIWMVAIHSIAGFYFTCGSAICKFPQGDSTSPCVSRLTGKQEGFVDGPLRSAQFAHPEALTSDGKGNLYVADTSNHRIRKIDSKGNVSTFAGSGIQGFGNGPANTARLRYPVGVAFDTKGNLYVADSQNHRIRKIDSKGNVSTFAGSGVQGFQNGPASTAQFKFPYGLAFDTTGNLYVADISNHSIRKIDNKGNVSTYAGTGIKGSTNGPAVTAQFKFPYGLAFDTKGNLYVTDSQNHRIRKIDSKGNVSTFAGSGTEGFRDGPANTAQFAYPGKLVFDTKGNLYVADTRNHRIRKIDSKGNVSTFSGSGVQGLRGGSNSTAQFNGPFGLTFDSKGNLYIADRYNHQIRKISRRGVQDNRHPDRKQGESCDLADPTEPGHHKCIPPLQCTNNQCN